MLHTYTPCDTFIFISGRGYLLYWLYQVSSSYSWTAFFWGTGSTSEMLTQVCTSNHFAWLIFSSFKKKESIFCCIDILWHRMHIHFLLVYTCSQMLNVFVLHFVDFSIHLFLVTLNLLHLREPEMRPSASDLLQVYLFFLLFL